MAALLTDECVLRRKHSRAEGKVQEEEGSGSDRFAASGVEYILPSGKEGAFLLDGVYFSLLVPKRDIPQDAASQNRSLTQHNGKAAQAY